MIENLPIEIFYMLMAVFGIMLGIGLVWKQGVFTMIAGIFLILIFLPVTSFAFGSVWVETGVSELCGTVDDVLGDALFTELYTTNTGWTQVSTQITVDSGAADAVHFNAAQDGTDRRVHKSLGVTLDGTFRLDFQVTLTAKNLPTHYPVVLSSSNLAPRTGAQDVLGVGYGSSAWGTSDTDGFLVVSKDSADSLINPHFSTNIAAGTGSTYYLTLERLSDTLVRLSVYSDSGRTTHVAGSPQITGVGAEVTGFTTVQHSVDSAAASSRTLTLTGDNLTIYDLLVGGDVECVTEVTGEFDTPAPVEIDYTMKALVLVFSGLMMMFGWWQSDFENPFGDSV